jgi:hypothetical protein
MAYANPQMLFLALMLLGAFAALVYFVVRSQLFAASLLLILFALTEGIRDRVDLSFSFGSFHLLAMDVVCAVFFGLAGYRILTGGVRSGLQGLCFVFVLAFSFHLARGIADFGLQEAFNSSRSWLYFLAALVFAATAPMQWDRRIWHLIAFTGLSLAVVSIPYLLTEGLHPAAQEVLQNGQFVTSRPISASGTLVILEAAILFLAIRWPSRRASGYCAAIAVAGVLVLQHRTIWVAALAVALVGFTVWSRRRLLQAESLVLGATGVVFLISPFAVWGIWSTSSFRASLAEPTSSHSTFSWRTQSWQELISSHHSVADVASGGPAGASWARSGAEGIVTVSPHSAFVEAFLRFGTPGLALFFGLFVVLWLRRYGVSSRSSLTGNAVGLILIAQGLYSVAYTLGPIQGLILGIFVSGLSWRSTEERAPTRAIPSTQPDAILVAR